MAENLRDIFTEVIVAPDFEPAALEVFKLKKNLRVLKLPVDWQQERMDVRLVSGGLLLQDADRFPDDIESVAKDWQLVSGERPADEEMTNLIFAWKACRAVKSNAIVLAKASATVGIGMGQVNRVDSCRLAVERAGDRAAGSVAASDAFFPFADGPQVLIDAGIKTIIQPGGSVRDRGGHRRGEGCRRHDVLHRGAPLLPLSGAARPICLPDSSKESNVSAPEPRDLAVVEPPDGAPFWLTPHVLLAAGALRHSAVADARAVRILAGGRRCGLARSSSSVRTPASRASSSPRLPDASRSTRRSTPWTAGRATTTPGPMARRSTSRSRRVVESDYPDTVRLVRGYFDDSRRLIADDSVDLLHIDGRHGYEDVLDRLRRRGGRTVRDGGIILFHDIAEHREGFGVWQLWEELSCAASVVRRSSTATGSAFSRSARSPTSASPRSSTPTRRRLLASAADYERLGAVVTRQSRFEDMPAEIASLHEVVASLSGEIERLRTVERENDERVAAIHSSTSWRVTRVLRAAGRLRPHRKD